MVGMAAFEGGKELYNFATKSVNASSDSQLDTAADHFAKAVTILGVEAVLAIIFRSTPKSPNFGKPRILNDGRQVYRNGKPLLEFKKVDIGTPPINGKIRYQPTTQMNQILNPRLRGETSVWGDIKVSMRLTGQAEQKTLMHEKVHRFLTPKFYFLRNVRVQFRANAYANSQLLRYLEEALSEGIARLSVYGFRDAMIAIIFPVRNGYVTISGLRAEARGIFIGPVVASGLMLNVSASHYIINNPE